MSDANPRITVLGGCWARKCDQLVSWDDLPAQRKFGSIIVWGLLELYAYFDALLRYGEEVDNRNDSNLSLAGQIVLKI